LGVYGITYRDDKKKLSVCVRFRPRSEIKPSTPTTPSSNCTTSSLVATFGPHRRQTNRCFDSVGFIIEDFSALRCIRRHSSTPFFEPLDMLADRWSRDLYGMLKRAKITLTTASGFKNVSGGRTATGLAPLYRMGAAHSESLVHHPSL
jgi:hypothetical protein